jgi:hypothetical protein
MDCPCCLETLIAPAWNSGPSGGDRFCSRCQWTFPEEDLLRHGRSLDLTVTRCPMHGPPRDWVVARRKRDASVSDPA